MEWVAIPFSRESSRPRDQTQVSHMAGRFLTIWPPGKPSNTKLKVKKKKDNEEEEECSTHILARTMGGWGQWLKKKKMQQVWARCRFPDGLTASPQGPRGPLLSILVWLNRDPEGNQHKAQLEGKTWHSRSALPVSHGSRDRQPFWTLLCYVHCKATTSYIFQEVGQKSIVNMKAMTYQNRKKNRLNKENFWTSTCQK